MPGPEDLPHVVKQIVFTKGDTLAREAWKVAEAGERRQAIGLLLARHTIKEIAYLLGISTQQVEHWRPIELPLAEPRGRGRSRAHTQPAAPAPPAEPAPEAAATTPQEETVPDTSSRPVPSPFIEPTQVPDVTETPEPSPETTVSTPTESVLEEILRRAAQSGVPNFVERAEQTVRALQRLQEDLETKQEAMKLHARYYELVDEVWVKLDELDGIADALIDQGFPIKEHRKSQRPKRRTPKP